MLIARFTEKLDAPVRPLNQTPHSALNILLAHQAFADQEALRALRGEGFDMVAGENTALGDQGSVPRDKRCELGKCLKARIKCTQVAIINSDQCPAEL